MQKRFFRVLAGVLSAVGFGVATFAASAQTIVSTGESFINARIVPGLREDGGGRVIGLRLSLAHGWKTYWRSPGDAGIPPEFDWSASQNVASVQIMWPRPELFVSFGVRTVGYSEQVVWPIRIVPEDPAAPISVALSASFGVCRDICVLEQVDISELILPDTPEIGAAQVRRAYASVPPAGADVGLTEATCRISGTGDERRMDASLTFDGTLVSPVVLLEGTERFWIRKHESRQSEDRLHVSAEMVLAADTTWLDRSSLRMTVLAEGFAADVQGCKAPAG